MDDTNIGPLVPSQRGVRDHARSQVLHRHAKLMKNGRPVFCTPSVAEMSGRVPPKQSRGTDGKVIYPTREAAEAAARELEALGARTLRSYVCGRSRRGHFHLTTDAGVRAAVPRPRTAPDESVLADEGLAGDAVTRIPRPSPPVHRGTPLVGLPLHLRIPRQAGPRAS
ncbi:hypothetical protein [Pseudonocardia humida]|uniref:Uncharacterized protein n=1 Tax=Pseudonocardia humida TaxID=2800819 RepID=A0ABT1A9T3_9PSEU|nr:hypothetical protein [Pseudonocardia humida]MCO1659579.1 hypothetical protein [Pseudonocardia humida]